MMWVVRVRAPTAWEVIGVYGSPLGAARGLAEREPDGRPAETARRWWLRADLPVPRA